MKNSTEIEAILIHRDNLTPEEAFEMVWEMRDEVLHGADPEDEIGRASCRERV